MVLELPTLVLNRNWVPIRVTTVEDAISKMFEGVAKAVAEDYSVYDFESWSEVAALESEPHIKTNLLKIRVPEVIVLGKYGDIPDRKLAFSRANIYKRDRYTCQYCGKRPDTEDLTIEHIVPRCRGGQSTWTNCVLACWTCNTKKADRTLAESGMKLISKPIKPDWSPRLVLGNIHRKNTPKNWEKFLNEAYWNVELKE